MTNKNINGFENESKLRIVLTIVLTISSVWFLVHALYDVTFGPTSDSFFESQPAVMVRIIIGVGGIIATIFQAYYWGRSSRHKEDVKMAINHYVKNRMQFLVLALELYDSDPSQENLAMLTKARNEIEQLVREVDLIVEEKLRAPKTKDFSVATARS